MKKTPTILYLITKSNLGGAQKYVLELAVAAKKRGQNVSVACGGTGTAHASLGPLVDQLQHADIPVHQIKNFLRDMSIIQDVRALFEIINILRRERPDVLHVTSSKAGGLGALAGRLTGIKRIVFTSHGLTMDETWRPRWQQFLITLGTWLTMHLAHHTILISAATVKRAQSLPGLHSRVSCIHNGIVPIQFADRTDARHVLAPQLPTDSIWIGGVGELHQNKNWHSLIAAVATLDKPVQLCIIGEGDERSALEQQIKDLTLENHVHLLGYQTAAPLLKAFDIFVLPSKKEGLPYVLLEAGLAKLPTIATTLPGNYDIIEHKKSGLLVTPDAPSLAIAIKTLLENPSTATAYGTALQQLVTEKFSVEKMLEETFATYLLE